MARTLTEPRDRMKTRSMTTGPDSDRPNGSRRKRLSAADEAGLMSTQLIANWQARFAWNCAMWGLIPVLGLVLGFLGVVFGLIGWVRVRRRPDDLGIRHAIGSIILGSVELSLNALGIALIVKGVMELTR